MSILLQPIDCSTIFRSIFRPLKNRVTSAWKVSLEAKFHVTRGHLIRYVCSSLATRQLLARNDRPIGAPQSFPPSPPPSSSMIFAPRLDDWISIWNRKNTPLPGVNLARKIPTKLGTHIVYRTYTHDSSARMLTYQDQKERETIYTLYILCLRGNHALSRSLAADCAPIISHHLLSLSRSLSLVLLPSLSFSLFGWTMAARSQRRKLFLAIDFGIDLGWPTVGRKINLVINAKQA